MPRHQQLDHEDDIVVWTTTVARIVRAQIRRRRIECALIDQIADHIQPITRSSESGIFLLSGKIGERSHQKRVGRR